MTLREARQAAGFTQEQFAAVAATSQQTISDYETGRRCPNVRRARHIERLLKCNPGEIIWPDAPTDEDPPAASGQ